MAQPIEPKPVKLEAPGPHETMVVEAVLDYACDSRGRLCRLKVRLEDGVELIIPLPKRQVEELRAKLQEFPEAPNWTPTLCSCSTPIGRSMSCTRCRG